MYLGQTFVVAELECAISTDNGRTFALDGQIVGFVVQRRFYTPVARVVLRLNELIENDYQYRSPRRVE